MRTKRCGASTVPRRAALCAISALACVLLAPVAQAQATTQTFNPTGGEQTFTVPAGVTAINVLAIGEAGAFGATFGGVAAQVTGELSVSPGQALYVEVADKTFNGGGSGSVVVAPGGGASDVRTSPRAAGLSPDTRLIVAGGGGGSGEELGSGEGGAAGQPGMAGPPGAGGGGAGTLTMGGAGGIGECLGTAGQLGSGGNGAVCEISIGGGGGGGYYGGGGGGGVHANQGGGGGGGGSSLVPAGGSMTLGSHTTKPVVQISYGSLVPTVTKVEPNHGSPSGGTSVTITGTGFTGATAVKFGSANAQSFTVNSATSITAVSPKGKGTVDVTVTTPAGTSPTSVADQFTFSKK